MREELEEGLTELQPMGEDKGRIQLKRTNRASRNMEISRLEGRVGCGLTILGSREEGWDSVLV